MPEQHIDPEVKTPLTDATEHLDQTVDRLIGHLTVAEKLNKRTQRTARFSAILGLVCAALLVVVVVLYTQVRHQANQNSANAVVSCQSGNDRAQANLRLWTYVIGLSAADPQNQSPADKRFLTQFARYVSALYAPRDCAHLNIRTQTPTPPTPPPPTRTR